MLQLCNRPNNGASQSSIFYSVQTRSGPDSLCTRRKGERAVCSPLCLRLRESLLLLRVTEALLIIQRVAVEGSGRSADRWGAAMIDSPVGGETTRSALRRLVDTLRVTVKEIKGKGKRRVGVTGEEPGRCESTIAKEGKTKSQQGGTRCQNMPVSGTKSEKDSQSGTPVSHQFGCKCETSTLFFFSARST